MKSGYRVCFRSLNARYHNVPQNRERLFIVARLMSKPQKKMGIKHFAWPRDLPQASFREIMDPAPPDTLAQIRRSRPAAKVAHDNVERLYGLMTESGLDPARVPMVMDVDSCTGTMMYNLSPCLTRTRAMGGGHWISCRGRRFSEREMRKVMGFTKSLRRPEGVSQRQWYGLLGNSIPVPLLQRVLECLLSCRDSCRDAEE